MGVFFYKFDGRFQSSQIHLEVHLFAKIPLLKEHNLVPTFSFSQQKIYLKFNENCPRATKILNEDTRLLNICYAQAKPVKKSTICYDRYYTESQYTTLDKFTQNRGMGGGYIERGDGYSHFYSLRASCEKKLGSFHNNISYRLFISAICECPPIDLCWILLLKSPRVAN
jgi:hypothetical protein